MDPAEEVGSGTRLCPVEDRPISDPDPDAIYTAFQRTRESSPPTTYMSSTRLAPRKSPTIP